MSPSGTKVIPLPTAPDCELQWPVRPPLSPFPVPENSWRTGLSQGSEVGEQGESWGMWEVTGARSSAASQRNEKPVQCLDSHRDF